MGGDLQSTYEQEIDRISQFELEAKQGGSEEFFQDILLRIDLFSRDWVFFQVREKITVEEYTELIHRKFDLIKTIKECCRQ